MTTAQITSIVILTAIFGLFILLVCLSKMNSLDGIKSKKCGDGQHGTARWATPEEIHKTYHFQRYEPKKWRKGENLPTKQGIILGSRKCGKNITALVDEGDVHSMMIGAPGVGKTASFLYPNLEYCCASGMSFLTTDTKGDLYRNYGAVAEDYYGYNVSIIDLRNPSKSDGFNMLYLVNRYMDEYLKNNCLSAKARAEKYSKIIAKTIVNPDGADKGQNAYFYESAEGILTAAVLLVAECCEPKKRHIVSVFKIIQELLAPSSVKGKNLFQLLCDKLPPEHKAKWFAGSALNTGDQAMMSVLSTALSRLNAFLDSELEQVLCFDTCIDAEKFCNTKSAIFLVLPEEDATKHFLVSLIVQQLYREILSVADENGGKLKNRVMMYLDEIGTLPPIQSAEMIFSASRSRRLGLVAIIQSLAQFERNYGKEGADIISDTCQNTIFGGFSPNSTTAERLSKNLGNQTVMTGTINRGKEKSSQLQMMSRPLMSPDELKTLPRFRFVVSKTTTHPMQTDLPLFFKWGISFDREYELTEHAGRVVEYADRQELEKKIQELYPNVKPLSAPLREVSPMPKKLPPDRRSWANKNQSKKVDKNESIS